MKIRQSFVSNSSTCSFCIYGISLERTSDLEERAGKAGLEHHRGEWEEDYVGRSWCNIGDDETGRQFKESVEKAVEQMMGSPQKCSTYEEAWYNG